MNKFQCKTNLLIISIIVLLALVHAPKPVKAQWPPFHFRLAPSSYENGKITYTINFSKQISEAMTDVTFKIPLPAGTRFLEADAPATTHVDFDGAEVTFFTSVLHRPLRDAFFVVEVTDPRLTVFTTHAWIIWKGSQPGDYLTRDVTLDITRQPLNWTRSRSRLQLEASATVTNGVATYAIYPTNVGGRMWDLRINILVPEGTAFLSAEAPPPFVANFDGQEVSFFIVELERQAKVGPLRFKVSTTGVTTSSVTTHAWATWKNVGRQVGRGILAPQEEMRTGDMVIQPHASQWVVSDMTGDVPFANYDITSIVFEADGTALKITFHTVEALGSVGEPVEYVLYIDSDCCLDTGIKNNNRGLEYRVSYRHDKGQAWLHLWDTEEEKWRIIQSAEVKSRINGNTVTMWVPADILEISQQLCWVGEARNRTKAFNPNPPAERVPNSNDLRLTQFEVAAMSPALDAQLTATEPSTNTSQ